MKDLEKQNQTALFLLQREDGFSIIELIVVLLVAAVLMTAGAITVKPILARNDVRNCGANMMSNIHLLRARAQSQGRRAVFELTNSSSAQDIDGGGNSEYYIGFLDIDRDSTYSSGDTLLIQGTQGDLLCSPKVEVDNNTLIGNQIIFDPLGHLLNGSANRNIYLKSGKTAARIELISMTGMMRYYLNTDDCGGDGCDTTDIWEELR